MIIAAPMLARLTATRVSSRALSLRSRKSPWIVALFARLSCTPASAPIATPVAKSGTPMPTNTPPAGSRYHGRFGLPGLPGVGFVVGTGGGGATAGLGLPAEASQPLIAASASARDGGLLCRYCSYALTAASQSPA